MRSKVCEIGRVSSSSSSSVYVHIPNVTSSTLLAHWNIDRVYLYESMLKAFISTLTVYLPVHLLFAKGEGGRSREKRKKPSMQFSSRYRQTVNVASSAAVEHFGKLSLHSARAPISICW